MNSNITLQSKPKWNPERFTEHYQKYWQRPVDAQYRPPMLNYAQNALAEWVSTKKVNFTIPLKLRPTFKRLTHHNNKHKNDGKNRKRRHQAIFSLSTVVCCLLEHTNVQIDNSWLDFLQINNTADKPTTIFGIARQTNLSESAIKAAFKLLHELQLITTERRKHTKANGDIVEIPAVRKFTERFFQLFGLSTALKNQKNRTHKKTKSKKPGQHQIRPNISTTRTFEEIQHENELFDKNHQPSKPKPVDENKIPEYLRKKSFFKA